MMSHGQSLIIAICASRQYLRIKRAVQAAFNTEASYLSAKLSQVQAGGGSAGNGNGATADDGVADGGAGLDPMAALDKTSGALGGAFVAASKTANVAGSQAAPAVDESNKDEIAMDDDDDDDDE